MLLPRRPPPPPHWAFSRESKFIRTINLLPFSQFANLLLLRTTREEDGFFHLIKVTPS